MTILISTGQLPLKETSLSCYEVTFVKRQIEHQETFLDGHICEIYQHLQGALI